MPYDILCQMAYMTSKILHKSILRSVDPTLSASFITLNFHTCDPSGLVKPLVKLLDLCRTFPNSYLIFNHLFGPEKIRTKRPFHLSDYKIVKPDQYTDNYDKHQFLPKMLGTPHYFSST